LSYFNYFLQITLLGFIAWYGYVILQRLFAWRAMPEVQVPSTYIPQTKLTIIIAVRNEAVNLPALLQDLVAQNYPNHLREVLIVDDYSEDETQAIVNKFSSSASFPIQYHQLKNYSSKTGKKAAIQVGVALAVGELLVFTDGDCRVPPAWLRHLAFVYQQCKAKFISGPVFFTEPTSIFEKIQLVEFSALVGVGAGSIQLKQPNMCNGANIAYPKHVFTEVSGFAGNENIASGDDEFLMHKVFQLYPEGVVFLKSAAAIVYTPAKKQFSQFIAQRIRWASKWPAYGQTSVKLVAVLVFSVNLLLLIYIALFIVGQVPGFFPAIFFGLKCLIDILFLKPILSFFKAQRYGLYIIPLQIIYVPYVVITALAGLKGSYTWKGRNIKT